jgi:hypothetical protein
MPLLPPFLLRHKTLVATVAATAAAGVLIAAGAVVAVALHPAARIAAIRLDSRAAAMAYARGDRLLPYVPVLTAPAGLRVTSPGAAAAAGRAFAAMAAALPGVRIADYATTHDRAFIAPGGRRTYALLYTAPGAGFGGAGSGPVITRALTAATPRGWHARLAEPPFAGAVGPWPGWGNGACGLPGSPLAARAGHCRPPGPPWAGPPWTGPPWAGPPWAG